MFNCGTLKQLTQCPQVRSMKAPLRLIHNLQELACLQLVSILGKHARRGRCETARLSELYTRLKHSRVCVEDLAYLVNGLQDISL